MSTENRSSNTEQMVSELLPCPFCGQKLELSNRKYNHWARCATDGCKGGQLPLLNTELAADIVSWNTRAQHQGDPVAVMYADGMMLTKADCGPAFETVCKVETPLYLHPPTSDGFSAGDMADQGAKAFREGQRAAIPEGFALVPKEMLLSKEVIGVINFHCGDTAEEEGGQFGQYTDGRLWVGNVTDDDGNQVHGLHIMTDEYPEEGSTTLIEFPAAPVNNPA
ncbi:hypothetical protein [Pseudomonas sp.]|uniref:hypothetical protein n=1 Tax=Pseudomonas sp. TaxID=306 RepID=UPI003BAF9A92